VRIIYISSSMGGWELRKECKPERMQQRAESEPAMSAMVSLGCVRNWVDAVVIREEETMLMKCKQTQIADGYNAARRKQKQKHKGRDDSFEPIKESRGELDD
jgi:hypothetical protein